jgi:hypothetical protein
MKNSKQIIRIFRRTGFKILRTIGSPFSTIKVLSDFFMFKRKNSTRFKISIFDLYPISNEKTSETVFDQHYIYHPAWAARIVKEINPEFHTDISSTLSFCTILSAFIPVKFYDYRPAPLIIDGLKSLKADLTKLPFPDNSIESISCMHTIEHVGLGRYGDPIDPDGDIKAAKELKRVVRSGGSLLIVTPVGKPRIEYNAHRIYSPYQIRDMFIDNNFTLKEFAFIPQRNEDGGIVRHAPLNSADSSSYACGCFWFIKK